MELQETGKVKFEKNIGKLIRKNLDIKGRCLLTPDFTPFKS